MNWPTRARRTIPIQSRRVSGVVCSFCTPSGCGCLWIEVRRNCKRLPTPIATRNSTEASVRRRALKAIGGISRSAALMNAVVAPPDHGHQDEQRVETGEAKLHGQVGQ